MGFGVPSSYAARGVGGGAFGADARHTRVIGHFRKNPGLEQQVASNIQMRAALREQAQKAVDEAKAIAPFRTGHYRDSIQAKTVKSQTANGRWVGLVVSTDFKANWIEFGTIKMAPKATLRRGTEAAGLKVKTTDVWVEP